MNAIFKTKDRLLITGSDSDERLIIKDFASASKDKNIIVSTLVDINGDETGLSIELVDKSVDNTEDASEQTPSK